MLFLPNGVAPNWVKPRKIEFGFTIQPATGAPAQYFDRAGTRMGGDFSLAPMRPDAASPIISRLLRGAREGLRVYWPLLGASQGNPGASVQVNGSGATGMSLPLKGLPVGYVLKEGYWLTVIDSAGVHYLHNVAAEVTANGSGQATATIYPPLRASLVNNNVVLLARPMIEGRVTNPIEWELPSNRLIQITFTLEEQA